jgi:protein-L-isoaspartate(D-aspartate) O-methyltransferase
VAIEKFGYHKTCHNFIEGLLRPNKILDPKLLDAFALISREPFLPAVQRQIAYLDSHNKINDDRFLLSPFVLAQLLNIAELKSDDKVLVIGAGTGYSMALLKKVVADVYGVECLSELRDEAEQNLAEEFGGEVHVHLGALPYGYEEKAPYDVILVEGAFGEIPQELFRQLSLNGRLVGIYKPKPGPGMGQGVAWYKTNSGISKTTYFDAQVPYLPGFEPVVKFKL